MSKVEIQSEIGKGRYFAKVLTDQDLIKERIEKLEKEVFDAQEERNGLQVELDAAEAELEAIKLDISSILDDMTIELANLSQARQDLIDSKNMA